MDVSNKGDHVSLTSKQQNLIQRVELWGRIGNRTDLQKGSKNGCSMAVLSYKAINFVLQRAHKDACSCALRNAAG